VLGFYGAVLACGVLVALVGLLFEVLVLRRVYGQEELMQLVMTVAAVLILRDVAKFTWGKFDLAVPLPRALAGALVVGGTYFPVFQLAMVAIGMSVLALMWAALHVVKSASAFLGGILADRVGRRSAIVAGWLVYAAVYAGFAGVATAGQAWGLFLVYGLYFGLTEGGERALVADLVPPETRASAYGVYHTAIGLAALPGSLLTGWLWQVFGAPVAFTTGAALSAAAAILLWGLLPASDRQS